MSLYSVVHLVLRLNRYTVIASRFLREDEEENASAEIGRRAEIITSLIGNR